MQQEVTVRVKVDADKETFDRLIEIGKAAQNLVDLIAAFPPVLEVQAQRVRNGECTIHDVRRTLGLHALPGGDERMNPLPR